MKDSKEYSQKVRKLYRLLKRKHPKVQVPVYDEPLDALVYAIVSEVMSAAAADSTLKRFADYFVDLNDLRVSRTEEVIELVGSDTAVIRDTVSALSKALGSVFGKYNAVSLKALKKMGKKPARQVLGKMDGVSGFAIDYCILTSLQAHGIPLTQRMVDYLRDNELVHPEADQQQIQGFLARQISADDAYEFYALLRRESESRRAGRKKKKTTRKTKKRTVATGKSKAKK